MSLNRTDWHRVDALLDAALQVEPAERARWLDAHCAADPSLRARLVRLIELAESPDALPDAGGLLDTAAAPDRVPDPGLKEGQLVGRYRVLGLLGAGGMGRVYRALDPTLGREVAIKALAHAFRRDASSLKRFEREARLLATITHPNVATIHGFEVLDGAPYLILELVEGRTLDEVLTRGALPLEEARAIALQVAEALEEAHRRGVVHRDLKPSNVMLGPGGRVKVLDFGLAKSLPAQDEGSAAIPPSRDTTASGTVLGTAPYMSPEQVRDAAFVDARADVWALGCVLYEMLAGRRAFPGASIPDVLAAVLRDEPDWNALPAETPPALRRLLRRCLRKDPHRRLQDIGDARLELQELLDEVPPSPPPAPLPRAALAVAALLAGLGLFVAVTAGREALPTRAQLALELPRGVVLGDSYQPPFALTPDGSRVVLAAGDAGGARLWVRGLSDAALAPLAGTEGAWQPFVSPDGRSAGFFADRKLKRVGLDGAAVTVLAEVGGNPRGATWTPGGEIVLAPSQTSGLVRLDERGGPLRPLTRLEPGESSHRWPRLVPGTRWVLFTVGQADASYDEARIEAVSLDSGERRRVMEGAGLALVAPGPVLLHLKGGRVYAAAFDAATAAVKGPPRLVLDGVRYDPRNGAAHLDVAASGTAVHAPGVVTSDEHYLALAGAGTMTRLVDVPRLFRRPRLSPDGTRVAALVGPARAPDLWTLDVPTATLTQLTFGASAGAPAWSPDGRHLAIAVPRDGGWSIVSLEASSGSRARELVAAERRLQACAFSPDGRWLVFEQESPRTGWDLHKLPLDARGAPAGPPQPLAATPFHETHAALSADGRFVAYESDELDNVVDVYVRSFPDGDHKVRVTTTGARWPRWAAGSRLVSWSTSASVLQATDGRAEGARFVAPAATPVWPGAPPALARLFVSPGHASFDVHPAGDRFLVLENAVAETEPAYRQPVVTLGWAGTLRDRLPR